MFVNVRNTLVVGLAAIALACTGPVGPAGEAGPAGPAGPEGPGFEAGPSISAVTPSWVVVGKTHTLQISGFATTWDASAAPSVSLGTQITVKKVTVASPTALAVEIEVPEGIAPGTRDITVTDGSETATFKGLFAIKPVLETEFFGTGEQGSVGVVKLKSNDVEFPLPTDDAEVTVAGPTGVNGGLWAVNPTDVVVYYFIAPDASVGTGELTIGLYEGTGRARSVTLPLNVVAPNVGTAMLGDTTVTIDQPYSSKSFAFVAQSTGQVDVAVTPVDADGVAPYMLAFDSSGTVVADPSSPSISASMGETYTLIVWASEGQSGAFTLTLAELASVADGEPNDDAASATPIANLPARIVGDLSGLSDLDFFKVTLPASAVGKKLVFTHEGQDQFSDADIGVIVTAPGGSEFANTGNLYFNKVFSTSTIQAEGEYLLNFALPTGGEYSGAYQVKITVE